MNKIILIALISYIPYGLIFLVINPYNLIQGYYGLTVMTFFLFIIHLFIIHSVILGYILKKYTEGNVFGGILIGLISFHAFILIYTLLMVPVGNNLYDSKIFGKLDVNTYFEERMERNIQHILNTDEKISINIVKTDYKNKYNYSLKRGMAGHYDETTVTYRIDSDHCIGDKCEFIYRIDLDLSEEKATEAIESEQFMSYTDTYWSTYKYHR